MTKHLHDLIVYSEEFSLINSPAFYDCVIHLICTDGTGSFMYNDRLFSMSKNNIAVLARPKLVTDIQHSADFKCEYIAAPDQFLHNLLPDNNNAIQ